MKKYNICFKVILLLFSLNALTDEHGVCAHCQKNLNSVEIPQVKQLSDAISLQCGSKVLAVGEICKTSKGFSFQYLGIQNGLSSYQDLASGLIWEDKIPDKSFFFDKAVEACQQRSARLPLISEVQIAEDHGFREVLPNSGYSYIEKWFIGGPKTFYTHNSYWAGDSFDRTRFGFLKFKKGYSYKMAKDYFEAWEVSGDANAFGTSVRCVRTAEK